VAALLLFALFALTAGKMPAVSALPARNSLSHSLTAIVHAGTFVCTPSHFWLLGTETVTVFVVTLFELSVQTTVIV
jgi:hypothetical protein